MSDIKDEEEVAKKHCCTKIDDGCWIFTIFHLKRKKEVFEKKNVNNGAPQSESESVILFSPLY